MEIIDASECSLTLKMVSAPSKSITIEYINYGDEWKNARKLTLPTSTSEEFTINDLEPSNTYQVRPTWEEDGVVKFGKEMVLDTGVPGCAGSKKKRGCVIA
ncbi:hypothetical protein TrCOL_g12454 [Triparma columacea]|uniref:Uncharacterized protein n=1 Tax=Triparma columacea TaxID=722753 RepID=A0A9W7FX82_9STRA|nr:hypothetical protein TrCOL_g12454 [Triparma columacea]